MKKSFKGLLSASMLALAAQPDGADFAGTYFGSHIGGNSPISMSPAISTIPRYTPYSLDPRIGPQAYRSATNCLCGSILGIEAAMSLEVRSIPKTSACRFGLDTDDFASFVFKTRSPLPFAPAFRSTASSCPS